jgi:hypothetical protein
MTQPSPLAPLPPRQPMTPLQPMVPLRPLTPLRPGESRTATSAEARAVQLAPPPMVEEPPPPQPRPVSVPQQALLPQMGYANPSGPAQHVVNTWAGPATGTRTRRRSSGGLIAAGIGVALVAVFAAIGSMSPHSSHTSVSIPSFAVSVPPPSHGGSAATGRRQPGAVTPRLGQSLSLKGNVSGESIDVAFTRWVNNAHPKDTFMDTPPSGKRLVAAQFRITNTGSSEYVDSPSNGAFVFDSKGRKYRGAFLFDSLREGKVFDAAVNLSGGKSAVGFLAFEVPKNAAIRRVEFSENSGFGQSGEWTIR